MLETTFAEQWIALLQSRPMTYKYQIYAHSVFVEIQMKLPSDTIYSLVVSNEYE